MPTDLILPARTLTWETSFMAVIPTSTLVAVVGADFEALDFDAIASADGNDLSNLLAAFENTETVELRRVRQLLLGESQVVVAGDLLDEADTFPTDHVRGVPGCIGGAIAGDLIEPGVAVSWETTYLAVIPASTLVAIVGVGADALDYDAIAGAAGSDVSDLLAMFENAQTAETRRVLGVLAGGVQVVTASVLLDEVDTVLVDATHAAAPRLVTAGGSFGRR